MLKPFLFVCFKRISKMMFAFSILIHSLGAFGSSESPESFHSKDETVQKGLPRINEIPVELLSEVKTYLGSQDLFQVRRVNQEFQSLFQVSPEVQEVLDQIEKNDETQRQIAEEFLNCSIPKKAWNVLQKINFTTDEDPLGLWPTTLVGGVTAFEYSIGVPSSTSLHVSSVLAAVYSMCFLSRQYYTIENEAHQALNLLEEENLILREMLKILNSLKKSKVRPQQSQ